MKLNLNTLKRHPRGSEHFHLQQAGNGLLLQDMKASFLEPLVVDLTVDNTGRLYFARGKLHTVLQLQCSRCLELFPYPLEADLGFSIVEKNESQDADREEDVLFLEQDEVDITGLLEEIIVTEIPFIPLCRVDCAGICPHCGVNKNAGNCHCEREPLDPRWEQLMKYKKEGG